MDKLTHDLAAALRTALTETPMANEAAVRALVEYDAHPSNQRAPTLEKIKRIQRTAADLADTLDVLRANFDSVFTAAELQAIADVIQLLSQAETFLERIN